jgi:amino acid transporter
MFSQPAGDRTRMLATLAVIAAAVLHALHVKVGTSFNNLVVVVKLVCFLIFLCVGIPFALRSGYDGLVTDSTTTLPDSSSLANRLMEGTTIYNMVVSLFYISLAYTGFNASIYLAGEIDRDPSSASGRSLVSRSMWMACALVMLFYLLLNYVFLYGLDAPSIVKAGRTYVADVANNIGGPRLSLLIRSTIILSAGTSVLAMMATGPMVYAQMAKDGRLPSWFEPSRSVPRLPILVQATLCCVLVWISEIQDIVGYLGLTLTACGALAVSSIWFAKDAFRENIPIRWYEHVCTTIYIAGAILFLVVAAFSQREFNQFLLCIATFVAGLAVYVLAKWL